MHKVQRNGNPTNPYKPNIIPSSNTKNVQRPRDRKCKIPWGRFQPPAFFMEDRTSRPPAYIFYAPPSNIAVKHAQSAKEWKPHKSIQIPHNPIFQHQKCSKTKKPKMQDPLGEVPTPCIFHGRQDFKTTSLHFLCTTHPATLQ